jgi:hypothetical protein
VRLGVMLAPLRRDELVVPAPILSLQRPVSCTSFPSALERHTCVYSHMMPWAARLKAAKALENEGWGMGEDGRDWARRGGQVWV